MPPTLVVLNPHAGSGRAARLVEPMRAWLAEHSPGTALVAEDSIDKARAMVQCLPRGSRVVLVGGDGTLHQMLPVFLTHRHILGLVPMGNGNDTARALRLHRLPWEVALQHAITGPTIRMDVGDVTLVRGHELFISSLAAGFDASVGQRALKGPAALHGLPRYLWATFGELASLRTWRMTVSADGDLVRQGPTLFASVLNTPSYGSGMRAVPGARIADAKLNLLVAGRFGRVGTLLMLPRLLLGLHLRHAKVRTRSFDTLRVLSDTPIPLAADGEPMAPQREFEVRVRPSAIMVARAPS
jgi:diacylglycerol kinase (ATP)